MLKKELHIKDSSPILFGSDPEVFLVNTDGHAVSAIDRIKGTKDKPVAIPGLKRGFYMQVDNVLVEYNTPAVDSSRKWFEAHTKALDKLREIAAQQDLSISIDASRELSDEELADPRAQVFGCDPDFSAWELRLNPAPYCANRNLRSAGGHIHVGMDMNSTDAVRLVRMMDAVLGSWATIVDKDTRRKELYGRPGAMRFKPYGVEYRTVSNFWLKTVENISIAYRLASRCTQLIKQSDASEHMDSILKMFKHNDTDIAKDLLEQYMGPDFMEELPGV